MVKFRVQPGHDVGRSRTVIVEVYTIQNDDVTFFLGLFTISIETLTEGWKAESVPESGVRRPGS